MMIRESFNQGLTGVLQNKLRSSLTVLGILIGVAAVIVLLAVGNGSSKAVAASIEKLGTNSISVIHGSFRTPGGSRVSIQKDLTVADAIALTDPANAPSVKSASPVKSAGSVSCAYAGTSHSTSITGTWPSYFETSNSKVTNGNYFSNEDVTAGSRVIVIGQSVVDQVYGNVDPVGTTLACAGVPFTVVGVLEKKGGSGFQDPDDVAIAPLTTVQRQLSGYGSLDSITAEAVSSDASETAQSEISSILDSRHGTTSTNRDYQVINQASLLTTSSSSNQVFTVLLGAVAAISLLVGGIGITNIMLVSVTERTREIGIRKAIGANRFAILSQFLVEATLLSVIGGAAGVVVALVVAHFQIAGVQPVIMPISVLGAFIVSVAIGLFFGSYPANRAARMRPIEALRHE
ncbi:MAG: ABC transporter permease [Actinomycetota bacterium]|nr:ABC transporter permease [Actinomycetota bacterium]